MKPTRDGSIIVGDEQAAPMSNGSRPLTMSDPLTETIRRAKHFDTLARELRNMVRMYRDQHFGDALETGKPCVVESPGGFCLLCTATAALVSATGKGA